MTVFTQEATRGDLTTATPAVNPTVDSATATRVNGEAKFVRYDPTQNFPMSTMTVLERVYEKIGVFEYRRIKDGAWCIRTIPTMHRELPLAAIGNSLFTAGKRMLMIVRLMES